MSGFRTSIERAVGSLALLLFLPLVQGCAPEPVGERLIRFRADVEEILGREVSAASPARMPLPARRDRRMGVGDQRMGPFDFLATLGCPLSELVAKRNAALGKVLDPSRRLAHELAVLDAIEQCRPTLSADRAARLAVRAEEKRADLASHVWNAVWLDAELERYLSAGPAALVGGSDPTDGPQQLGRAADAIRQRDVPGVESAFQSLRDDAAWGPRLMSMHVATRELSRVADLLTSFVASPPPDMRPTTASRRNPCDRVSNRLSKLFQARYASLQPELASLDRDGRAVLDALRALLRASASRRDRLPEAMRRFDREWLEDASGQTRADRLRRAVVDHAQAWGPILERCDVVPGQSGAAAGS